MLGPERPDEYVDGIDVPTRQVPVQRCCNMLPASEQFEVIETGGRVANECSLWEPRVNLRNGLGNASNK